MEDILTRKQGSDRQGAYSWPPVLCRPISGWDKEASDSEDSRGWASVRNQLHPGRVRAIGQYMEKEAVSGDML